MARKQPEGPASVFPAPHGTLGRLELRADLDGYGRVSHSCYVHYVGQVENGKLAFAAPAEFAPIYLAADEVVSFEPAEETS